jgi:hypothetical protein
MHPGTILLTVIGWILLFAGIGAGILIQPYAGDGRGERHPGRVRRYLFHHSVLMTAFCLCNLLASSYSFFMQVMWVIPAFVFLARVVCLREGRLLRRHFRTRPVPLNAPTQT